MAVSKHLQAPWNGPEREATATASHRGKMILRGVCVSSPKVSAGLGFGSRVCREHLRSWRHLAVVGGWAPDQTLPCASSADGRAPEAKAFLSQPCVLWHAVMAKLFWCTSPQTVSVLLRWHKMKWELFISMREREEGNEIRTAFPTIAHLSPPSGWTSLAPISRNQHFITHLYVWNGP